MPEDKKKRPSASTIAKVMGKLTIPGVGPFLVARDIASRVALNRMAKNLDPYNYADDGTGESVLERATKAIILNKKEPSRTETEQYIEKGYGKIPEGTFKERVDLLQMLAGKNQKYNTIEKSPYIPTVNAEKGVQYYRSKGIENEILKDLGISNITSQKQLEEAVEKKSKGRTKTKGYSAIIPGLADATYRINRDNKGLYLDYTDIWDLDPQEGAYAEKKANTTIGSIGKILKSAATNVVNATATPARVYGRIYFDPKTGKPIR